MSSSTLSGRRKRFRCHNCDKLTIKNPTQPKQRFCSDACRYEYNKHGAAFGPLKAKLEKLVRQIIQDEVARLKQDIGFLAQVEIEREGLGAENNLAMATFDRLLKLQRPSSGA